MRWLNSFQLNEHEFEKALGDSEGQGSLESCSPWGCKESDTSKQHHQTWGEGVAEGSRVEIAIHKSDGRVHRTETSQ